MTKITIITGQNYLDDEIVETKRAAKDYTVYVSPIFEIDGTAYRAILDGNHSLAAAMADGAEPEYTERTAQDDDRVGLIHDIELFLESAHMDGDYINAITRSPAF